MTPDDITRIEQSLGVTLPESYRALVVPYPIPAARGNSDLGVWDDVERLIAFNLELRAGAAGGVKPWPAHVFAMGHPGDGSPYALDLSQGDAVWWVDRCHLDNPASGQEAASFASWGRDYFETLREEMRGELVDPDGTPEARAQVESRGAWQRTLGCLVLAVLVTAGVWVVRRLLA